MSFDPARLPELFDRALELEGADREQFLDKLRLESEPMVEQLIDLLKAEKDAIATDRGCATARELVLSLDYSTLPSIPGYQLLECIGRGGMGAVYRAEDLESQRVVALKALSNPLGTPELRWRFQYEASVLSRLDHPGIARVYDAGIFDTDFGPQPFYSMELVPGHDIVSYAKAQDYNFRESLSLLATVCDAVQHAHAEGIVHRDLKPANILVPEDGTPRVLDFGIARDTELSVASDSEPGDTLQAARTRTGDIVGTIGYMSPEQAAGNAGQADVRSDVYSLGVLGYELLTGELPHPVGDNLIDALRSIVADPPQRLGSRDQQYRGDVETLLGRALEKSPARRYPSTAEFASEIRRYLKGEPIHSRAPGLVDRSLAFVRRHRGFVAAVIILIASLTLGLVGTLHERGQAEQRAVEADRALGLIQSLFGSVQGRGREVRMIDALNASASSLVSGLDDAARVEARIRHVLGVAYASLGEFEVARDHYERALTLDEPNSEALRRDLAAVLRELGDFQQSVDQLTTLVASQAEDLTTGDLSLIESRRQLALSLNAAGKIDEAIKEIEVARSAIKLDSEPNELRVLQLEFDFAQLLENRGDDARTRSLLEALLPLTALSTDPLSRRLHQRVRILLSDLQGRAGMEVRAIALHEELLPELRVDFGDRHPKVMSIEQRLANLYFGSGRYEEASALVTPLLEKLEQQLGRTHPSYLSTLIIQADMLGMQGNVSESHRIMQEILKTCSTELGSDHPLTIRAEIKLGYTLITLGDLPKAESVLSGGLERAGDKFGVEDGFIAAATANLSQVYARTGRVEKGRNLCEALLARIEPALPPGHTSVVQTRLSLAHLALAAGDLMAAQDAYREALTWLRISPGESHPETIVIEADLGRLYLRTGQAELGLEHILRAFQSLPDEFAPDHRLVLRVRASLGVAYRQVGRLAEAESVLQDVVERQSNSRGQNPFTLAMYQVELGRVHAQQVRHSDAITRFLEAVLSLEATLGPGHPQSLLTRVRLGLSYIAEGKASEAESSLVNCVDLLTRALGLSDPRTRYAQRALVTAYIASERYTEAEELCRSLLPSEPKKVVSGEAAIEAFDVQRLMSDILNRQKRFQEALPHAKRAVSMAETTEAKDSARISSQRVLGESLLGLGRSQESEPHLRAALEGARREPRKCRSRRRCLDAMIRWCEHTSTDSEPYRQELLDLED